MKNKYFKSIFIVSHSSFLASQPLFILAFLLGVCSILLLTRIPSFFLLITIFIVVLVGYVFWRNKITLLLLGVVCGCCWVMLYAYLQLEQRLPVNLQGKNLSVVGTIISLPYKKEHFTSFLFKTITIQEKSAKRLYKLNWYQSKSGYKQPQLHPGDKWRLIVRLKRAHAFMNPGGFDYAAYLFAQGIAATGYIVNNDNNRLLRSVGIDFSGYVQLFNKLRQQLQIIIKRKFDDQPLSSFLLALIIGSQQQVTQEQWRILRRTGTNHLIAIAGLHVGLIAGFVFLLISFCWRRVLRLSIRIPAQQLAACSALLAALFYSLLAGFSLQTQRAFIMLLIVMGAVLFKRQVVSWHGLCLALLFVLLINPLNVLTTGFWMSFVSVATIIYATHGRIHINSFWQHWGKIQLVIMLGLIPLSLLIFHEASLIAIVANCIAVPWFGFVIMPLCFIGVVTLMINSHLSYVFLWLALKNLQGLWLILKFLAQLPLVVWHQAMPHIWLFGFVVIAIILLLAPRGFPARYLSVIFFLPLLTFHAAVPKFGRVWFTLLDVGQGLAAIVRTHRHILLFDTGAKFSEDFNAGEAVILPYLSVQGIRCIDKLIVSHGDNDHIGGAAAILQNIKVGTILSSVPAKLAANAQHCYRGQQWRWDGVQFKVLWPLKGKPYAGNNSSCVLQIKVGKQSILLTGDIEKNTEDKLLRKFGKNLTTTIIVVPHHGSDTSSSWRFVQTVHPKYALYPVGYLNRFHFPNTVVMQRYRQIGAQNYDTVHAGAITFRLDGIAKKLHPKWYRVLHQHIWAN